MGRGLQSHVRHPEVPSPGSLCLLAEDGPRAVCAQRMWWLAGFSGAGEPGMSLKPPDARPMANAGYPWPHCAVLVLMLLKRQGIQGPQDWLPC